MLKFLLLLCYLYWAQASFEKSVLNEHNKFRAMHGAPPLKLNAKLSKQATQWAHHLGQKGILEHSKGSYGENLFSATGMKPINSVKYWYDEIKHYNYNNPTFSMNTGHFTQVVWKSSKFLGVGLYEKGKTSYVVAQYQPAGNMMGAFKGNVLPKKAPSKGKHKIKKNH